MATQAGLYRAGILQVPRAKMHVLTPTLVHPPQAEPSYICSIVVHLWLHTVASCNFTAAARTELSVSDATKHRHLPLERKDLLHQLPTLSTHIAEQFWCHSLQDKLTSLLQCMQRAPCIYHSYYKWVFGPEKCKVELNTIASKRKKRHL